MCIKIVNSPLVSQQQYLMELHVTTQIPQCNYITYIFIGERLDDVIIFVVPCNENNNMNLKGWDMEL